MKTPAKKAKPAEPDMRYLYVRMTPQMADDLRFLRARWLEENVRSIKEGVEAVLRKEVVRYETKAARKGK